MKKILLRSDDFGSVSGANEAIMKLAQSGLPMNVSVMVCVSGSRQAAEKLRQLHPSLSMGIHLALTSEWDELKWGPLGSAAKSSGMVDKRGYFLPDYSGLLAVKPEVVIEEIREQIREAQSWGVNFSYMDDHMGFSWIPPVREGMVSAAKEFGLVFKPELPMLSVDRKIPDVVTRWRTAISSVGAEPLLLITHPMIADESTRYFYNANHPPGRIPQARQEEFEMLSGTSWRTLLREEQVSLIAYRDLVS